MRSWMLKLGGLGGAVALLSLFFLLPPLPPFQLKEVVVITPTTRLTETDLVKLSGVEKGKNLLTLSLKKVRGNLLKFPWIEEVALAKSYPGRLIVSVKEQQPAALVKLDGLYLVNHEGELFKKLGPGDPKDFPIVTGLSPAARDSLPRLLQLIGDFQAREALRAIGLSEIHWERSTGVTLFTLRPAIKVVLGTTQWKERLDKLVKALPEMGGKKGMPLSIDLTYEKKVFVKTQTKKS